MEEQRGDRRAVNRDLEHAVQDLTGQLKDIRLELVRKDVYDITQVSMNAHFTVIEQSVSSLRTLVEKQNDQRTADRRLLITSFALPILLIFLQLYLASQTGSA